LADDGLLSFLQSQSAFRHLEQAFLADVGMVLSRTDDFFCKDSGQWYWKIELPDSGKLVDVRLVAIVEALKDFLTEDEEHVIIALKI
tara:strand:- start:75 stop:335 length:261 start_codon:yes stop_codon:yes gene_type:complete